MPWGVVGTVWTEARVSAKGQSLSYSAGGHHDEMEASIARFMTLQGSGQLQASSVGISFI